MSEPASTATASEQARCPSCGRFVGPYETCPYCGARLRPRLTLRAVKLAAVLLATVGLLALWWIARQARIPTLTAAEAQGSMNMAYVQVQGQISRAVTYDPEGGYLAFWVDDGTGEVHVTAYRAVTQALLAAGQVPALGDQVTVAGTLRIREDMTSLTINAPEHFTLSRPTPIDVAIGDVTASDTGRRVRVTGTVRDYFQPYKGLWLIDVQDETGEITVAIDETTIALTGPLPSFTKGQVMTVAGVVSLYKETPQLVPASTADLVVSEPATATPTATAIPSATPTPAPTRPGETATPAPTSTPTPTPTPTATPTPAYIAISRLTAEAVGQTLTVQGRVVALEGFKGGVKATLDDGTGQLLVLLWMDTYTGLKEPAALDVGAEVAVTGELQVYQGALELIPGRARDVKVQVAAPPPPWVQVSALSAANAGQVVRLRGVLGEPQPFSAGIRVPLDDGTGTMLVILWSNVAEALAQPPAAGMMVEVVGVVEVYKDQLELVPRSPVDWRPAP